MENRGLIRGIAIAVLVLAAAAAIGIGAYNAGVARGIAESGRFAAAPPSTPGAVPYVYVWPHHWGFGFFPVFFLIFFFFALRGLLWGGPWRRGWGGPWRGGYSGVPPAFEEWHRRAHEQQATQTKPSTTA
jgi:hypothetical protein